MNHLQYFLIEVVSYSVDFINTFSILLDIVYCLDEGEDANI